MKRLVALHPNDFQSKVVRICFRNILPNEDLTASTGANIWTKHTLVCEAIMGKKYSLNFKFMTKIIVNYLFPSLFEGKWQADFKKPIYNDS